MKKKHTDSELLTMAISIYQSKPFVNKIWMKMQGFDSDFVDKNWDKITGTKNKKP